METLWAGEWSSELVVNKVKSAAEVDLIRGHGIIIHLLPDIVSEIQSNGLPIKRAAGSDFIDLLQMGAYAGAARN